MKQQLSDRGWHRPTPLADGRWRAVSEDAPDAAYQIAVDAPNGAVRGVVVSHNPYGDGRNKYIAPNWQTSTIPTPVEAAAYCEESQAKAKGTKQ